MARRCFAPHSRRYILIAPRLRTVSGMDHAATLDGTPLFTRRTWDKFAPSVSAAAFELQPGRHRLMVRVAKDEEEGNLYLSLARLDGERSDVKFSPSRGAAPR